MKGQVNNLTKQEQRQKTNLTTEHTQEELELIQNNNQKKDPNNPRKSSHRHSIQPKKNRKHIEKELCHKKSNERKSIV